MSDTGRPYVFRPDGYGDPPKPRDDAQPIFGDDGHLVGWFVDGGLLDLDALRADHVPDPRFRVWNADEEEPDRRCKRGHGHHDASAKFCWCCGAKL